MSLPSGDNVIKAAVNDSKADNCINLRALVRSLVTMPRTFVRNPKPIHKLDFNMEFFR